VFPSEAWRRKIKRGIGMHTFVLALALQCFLPLFDVGADYVGLSVVNNDSQQHNFTVQVNSPDGQTSQSAVLPIPAGNERAFLLNELLSSKTLPSSGWIRVDGFNSQCPLYLTSGNSESLTGLDPASVLSTSILLPHIEVNTGFVELEN